MMFRAIVLPQNILWQIYLHSMPGRYEKWNDFVAETKRCGIDVIVCLAPNDEIEEKSPLYANAIRDATLSCQREYFPIPDYDVPQDREAYATFLKRLAERLRRGKTVLVHCGAGIGRTGTFAICLLLAIGVTRMEAEKAIHNAGSHPETDEQRSLVDWCEKNFPTKQHTA